MQLFFNIKFAKINLEEKMKIKHISQEWLKLEIKKILNKYLDKSFQGFFFGSRMRGDVLLWVDIDIGIEGHQAIPIAKKLGIKEDLEKLPTLYKFDLVDFKTVSSDFKKEAFKYREFI